MIGAHKGDGWGCVISENAPLTSLKTELDNLLCMGLVLKLDSPFKHSLDKLKKTKNYHKMMHEEGMLSTICF